MIILERQSLHVLSEVLDALEPVELEGMQLLERLRPAPRRMMLLSESIDRDTLRRATLEIIDYTGRCQHMQTRLLDLNPVPLTSLIIVEFGL